MSLARELWNGTLETIGAGAGAILSRAIRSGAFDFTFTSQALSQLPFSVGWKLRRAIYAQVLDGMGRGSVVHHGVVLDDARTRIGSDVWIATGAYLEFAVVEDSVLIGPHAVILAGKRPHNFERSDVAIKHQGNPPRAPVHIGEGAWIGANATVMADVGAHAIVGAGSVVTQPVEPWTIVAGNPARLIRRRAQKAG